jgi:hypothetical protein
MEVYILGSLNGTPDPMERPERFWTRGAASIARGLFRRRKAPSTTEHRDALSTQARRVPEHSRAPAVTSVPVHGPPDPVAGFWSGIQ